jgi:hypothetical protein
VGTAKSGQRFAARIAKDTTNNFSSMIETQSQFYSNYLKPASNVAKSMGLTAGAFKQAIIDPHQTGTSYNLHFSSVEKRIGADSGQGTYGVFSAAQRSSVNFHISPHQQN